MRQGKLSGLLPIGVFLILFIGSGILFQDFYAMPAIVAFLLALAVALIRNQKRVKTNKGAQLGIAALSSLVDISTANNTIAIVMAGPIAKDISEEFGIEPKRTAALLDIFTSVWQGIIPYGAQLLYASAGAAAVDITIAPMEIIPYLFYPMLMGISGIVAILCSKSSRKSTEQR